MTNDSLPAIKQFTQALTSPAMKEQISKLLPTGVDYDRFTRTTMVAINTNPDLLSADRQSLYNAISKCAADGLVPDGRQAALVLYSEKRGNGFIKAVRHMPMVEGITFLMAKAGWSVFAISVYENDKIEVYSDENGQHLKHWPEPFSPRGAFKGVAAVARKGDMTLVETLNLDEIDRIRASSKSGEKGPWSVWFDRMAQKSVLHRIKKRVPILDADIADSLSDPEEEETLESADSPQQPVETTEVEAAGKRRPRGLQAVVEAAVEPEKAEEVAEPEDYQPDEF
jgi:recombination protein RecT